MAPKTALVLLAEGSEEIEAVVTVDVLRRGGVTVTLAGVASADVVECSRKVKIVPDASLEEAVKKGPYDIVILPGGLGGTKKFIESEAVGSLLKEQESAGRMIAAICAAPTALKAHKIGFGNAVTAYPHPDIENEMQDGSNYVFTKDRVVVQKDKLITSQGPGTAFEFALKILEHLNGPEAAENVAAPLILPKNLP